MTETTYKAIVVKSRVYGHWLWFVFKENWFVVESGSCDTWKQAIVFALENVYLYRLSQELRMS